MFVKTYAGAIVGIDAVTVTVEVNLAESGLGLYLVGLPDNAVKESEQRIRSAFENTNLRMTAKRLVVNLAPADLRKEGAAYDLPLAIGLLAADEQIAADKLSSYTFMRSASVAASNCCRVGILPSSHST